MVRNFKRTNYGVFRGMDGQQLEYVPIFTHDGKYNGARLTIYSQDKRYRKYQHHTNNTVINRRTIELNGKHSIEKEMTLESMFDIARLHIRIDESNVRIDYECRKKILSLFGCY